MAGLCYSLAMVTKHPKESSKETLEAFQELVPSADVDIGDSLATVIVDGAIATIRVKRAASMANQVQVWRGEPLVVHVPSESGDRWYVLPVSWQLSYARANSLRAKQHASHAFDCMMIPERELPVEHEVTADTLLPACQKAIRESHAKEMRFVIKAITRARGAVADALIATLEEEFDFKS